MSILLTEVAPVSLTSLNRANKSFKPIPLRGLLQGLADVRFWPEADKCNVVPRYVDKSPEGSAGYPEGGLPEGCWTPEQASRHGPYRGAPVE